MAAAQADSDERSLKLRDPVGNSEGQVVITSVQERESVERWMVCCGNAIVFCVKLLPKLEISFNGGLVEVLSAFWVNISWFVCGQKFLMASKVAAVPVTPRNCASDVMDAGT